MIELLAAAIFAAAYIIIALEHQFFVSKAATSIVLAATLWVISSLVLTAEELSHSLSEASVDIFSIVVFLLTAMTLIEVLVHYRFFDFIEQGLRRRNLNLQSIGWVVVVMTFFLSAILDNLTTTIIMIQIARRFFPVKEQLKIAALIVIAANAGGAFSPIGDVTTIMLWFAGKFTAGEVLSQGFLPALTLTIVSAALILWGMPKERPLASENGGDKKIKASRSDRAIIGATLASFLLPLAAASLNLPPYIGLLAGLGIVWLMIDAAKKVRPQPTHLAANIKQFLQHTDIESIQFFVGILLAVAALHALGLLDIFTDTLFGHSPTVARIITAFTGLGLGSAIIDNVPLTAAAISSLDGISSALWVLLAFTVGTGGSLLVIGSAAGVVAMGMLPNMTFMKYLRLATIPAFVGFAAGVGVWLAQYYLFF